MTRIARIIAVSFGFTCVTPAIAETLIERDLRREQSALESGWVFGLAHDGGCSIMATARSPGRKAVALSLGWTADDGFGLMLTTDLLSQLEAPVIEVVGTSRSYAIPKTPIPKINGHDAVELKQDISAGRALRLSDRTRASPSGPFDFPVGSGAMTIAALDACAEMFKAHPVPPSPESRNIPMVHSHNLESSCSLSGFWYDAGGFWIVIEAARDGANIRLYLLASKPTTARPVTIDLRGLGGDVMKFENEGEMTFATERIASLEDALLAGDTRAIRLEFPGKSAEVLEFGGPRARAPAAMFSVCRAMLNRTLRAP